jgi:hypothetical protein
MDRIFNTNERQRRMRRKQADAEKTAYLRDVILADPGLNSLILMYYRVLLDTVTIMRIEERAWDDVPDEEISVFFKLDEHEKVITITNMCGKKMFDYDISRERTPRRGANFVKTWIPRPHKPFRCSYKDILNGSSLVQFQDSVNRGCDWDIGFHDGFLDYFE